MATETDAAEIIIDRDVDAVWPLVGDFGGLGWMPGVESVVVDGNTRTIGMGGMEIKEELRNLDDDAKQITYAIVDGPVPVESHEATISVAPEGDGCRVTWSVTSAPEGTAEFFASIYSGALEALKAKAEAEA